MPDLRGRKRTPTALRIVDGNAGKRPLPKNEPQPEVGEPPMPSAVEADPVAMTKWRALVRDLTLRGARVLTIADGHQLELAALTYSDMVRARTDQHWERVEKRQRALQGCLDRLGLNPAMRGKVQVVEEPKHGDPAEGHFTAG